MLAQKTGKKMLVKNLVVELGQWLVGRKDVKKVKELAPYLV
jgi:hypothetical protein